MSELTQSLEAAKASPSEKSVFDLIARMGPELERALPAHLGGERFARIVTTEIRRTPKLLDCSPASLLGAMMLAAQLGLEPGPLGHVYLVPFGREVTFVIGYKGMIDLAYRSGQVKQLDARLVHDGDTFEYEYGTSPRLRHVPLGPPDDREIVAAYAVAQLKTGGKPFVPIYPADWELSRKRSAAGKDGKGPWATDFAAMVRKTAVRRLQPFIPQSPQWLAATSADELPAPAVDAPAFDLAALPESEPEA